MAKTAAPRPAARVLIAWTGVQLLILPVLLLLAALLGHSPGEAAALLLTRLPYPHGTVKFVLESSQGLLLKQRELLAALPLALAAGLWPRGAPTGRWIAGLLALLALALSHRFGVWPAIIALPLITLAGEVEPAALARLRPLIWAPLAPLWAPAPWAAALGLPPAARRALAGAAAVGLLLLSAWAECLAGYRAVRDGLERWPAELLDPRIRVLAHSPPGVRADWHGVQIVGDHAIVVGETRPRLVALPLDVGRPVVEHSLGPRWGPESAAPLDADTDPESGLTWVISGARTLSELRWTGAAFAPVREIALPAPISYAYVRRAGRRLILASVQTAGPSPRLVISGQLPSLDDLRAVELAEPQPGGRPRPIPMPREVVYAPPIDALVVAPDFGPRLYTAGLSDGAALPWLPVPTLDGKMIWAPELGRIALALPNRATLWFIDPVTGAVDWEVPTQPGVRAVAVDADRGLLVTASVLTGQIWVQDLRSGAVCDRLGTVMPMARELALSPTRGEGVLTTWASVYQFPYTCGRPLPAGQGAKIP
ncbi:MAG: hypothetical protein JNM72_21655 [Deltaproteobacteria bacterium]|nr:hypothetical protein [Deltaproteobacteria bacterium]